ncbi:MAG TPA: site-specific integrase [Pyrinomonadaceae bacterium]|jgi:integrase
MLIKKVKSKRARGDVWMFDFQYRGKRYRQSNFGSRKLCDEVAHALHSKLQRQHFGLEAAEGSRVTLAELITERLKRPGDPTQQQKRERYFQTFAAMLEPKIRVQEITTQHYGAFVEARCQVVKLQTAFRELTEIVSMINSARDYFPSLENWTPPRRPRLRIPSGQRERIITSDEAARILAELRCPREEGERERTYGLRLDAADLLQIALQTAARRMEIMMLRWSDVNFEWHTLRVVGKKTEHKGDHVRVIPLADSLLELFKRRHRETMGSDLVFPIMLSHSMFNSQTNLIFEVASKRAGIPYGRDTAGGWVLHDARHTAITAMLHAGNSLESVMSISGHHAKTMVMRYSHSTEKTRRAAISALDGFGGDISSGKVANSENGAGSVGTARRKIARKSA